MGKEEGSREQRGEFRKAISIALILALVINITLFAARKIHALQFWLVIIVAAVFAFVVLKRWK